MEEGKNGRMEEWKDRRGVEVYSAHLSILPSKTLPVFCLSPFHPRTFQFCSFPTTLKM
jgi:hypothetical protein